MSNSKLVEYTDLSPMCDKPRAGKISKITIHHAAGNASLQTMGRIFHTNEASANYGIDSQGRVALYVDEANGSWASSSPPNDNIAVTIEVANDGDASSNWHVSDKAIAKCIDLCVDICERNGIAKLNYTGDTSGNLTRHNMFVATACPGPYLQSKFPYIAGEVNKRLSNKGSNASATDNAIAKNETDTIYRVQVGAYSLKTNADKTGAKLKSDGYSIYMVTVNGLYKVQTGAFKIKKNAERLAEELRDKGYATYITTQAGKPAEESETKGEQTKQIIPGSLVRVKYGAKTYTGGNLADFVYYRIHKVGEVSEDRAVITYNGVVVAAVKLCDLETA